MTYEQEYRALKRKGDVKALRKLREGTVTAIVEPADPIHTPTVDEPDTAELDLEEPTEET